MVSIIVMNGHYGYKLKETTDEDKIYFEDLPAHAHETIIDLIVPIIKNKQREQEAEKLDTHSGCSLSFIFQKMEVA